MTSSHTFARRLFAVLTVALALLVAMPAMGQRSKSRKKRKATTTATTTKAAKTAAPVVAMSHAVDLGLSVRWADCNVGATTPEGYGGLYGYADATGQLTTLSADRYITHSQPADITGNANYDIARAKWGGTWRLPTSAELEELTTRCQWQWTTLGGVNGYRVTGPSGNSIFLPAAGFRYGTSVTNRGEFGYLQSGTLYSRPWEQNFYVYFSAGGYELDYDTCLNGYSVRPVTK